MDPRAGLDRCEKSRTLPGLDPRILPVRSESLYRLSYPGPLFMLRTTPNTTIDYFHDVVVVGMSHCLHNNF